MPETIYLTERRPLVFKVAKWLTAISPADPIDLSQHAVLVPTAAAARRLRFETAKAAGETGRGLLSPAWTTPMGLLAFSSGNLISRADALLAWMKVISQASPSEFPAILSAFSDHRDSSLRLGEALLDLCSLLAEAGLTPVSPEIAQACPQHEDRWNELGSLYRRYLESLGRAGLVDANSARIDAARGRAASRGISRVVLAGVPDLNRICQEYLENLESSGLVRVTVLVDAPACDGAGFDQWGRPDLEAWTKRLLPVRLKDVIVAAELASEGEVVADLVGPEGDPGVCVADAGLISPCARALRRRGLASYDPAGKSLASFECATIARLWLSFCASDRLADLRGLGDCPVFLQEFCAASRLEPSAALASLDAVRMGILVETVADARAFFERRPPAGKSGAQAAALIEEAWTLRERFGISRSLHDLSRFLRALYARRRVAPGSGEAEALAALSALLRAICDSPLSDPDSGEAVFCEEMRNIAVFERPQETDIELNGWLEASWLPNSTLILSGCTEGAVPASVPVSPFLPDSICRGLGLQNNAQRFARDACLLHCLIANRNSEAVKLTLSRIGSDGEPSRPSRLLFRCPDEELPTRVRSLFSPGLLRRPAHARERTWLLDVPERPALDSLPVTAFRDYLQCPLRFYFKHVLQMRRFDARKAEMDALDFGSVLHETVERFANNESIRDSSDAAEIEKFVLAESEVVLADRFGNRLSLPVRVQRESLRARLRRFARLQARERESGWRIQCGELRFEKEDTLVLATLPIVGSLDRVDIHEGSGKRRILDYKTSAQRSTANEFHFEEGKGQLDPFHLLMRGKLRRWKDLQLPLYRALARLRWPGEDVSPSVAYFFLPERIDESSIEEFALDDAVFNSAMSCAQAVAENIGRGIFWPPRAVEYDDYDTIFLGEDPENVLSEESKRLLSGSADLRPAP